MLYLKRLEAGLFYHTKNSRCSEILQWPWYISWNQRTRSINCGHQ